MSRLADDVRSYAADRAVRQLLATAGFPTPQARPVPTAIGQRHCWRATWQPQFPEPLPRGPRVTDVLVNAPDEVWVDRGDGLERAAVRFADDRAVRRLAQTGLPKIRGT